jgi:hypothetical protein
MQTTYFARAKNLDPTLNLISIARFTPPGFPGRKFLSLAPTEIMLDKLKDTGDREKYTIEYSKILEELDVHEIAKEAGKDAILVCYEGVGKFCHRHLVSMWFMKAGYVVTELVV